MNLQTTKPKARFVRRQAFVMMGRGGMFVDDDHWRVTFPDSPTGFTGRTLEGAVAVAYRGRLARITGRRDA
jgi:hypothetical protein